MCANYTNKSLNEFFYVLTYQEKDLYKTPCESLFKKAFLQY